jgi:hypothetical protein
MEDVRGRSCKGVLGMYIPPYSYMRLCHPLKTILSPFQINRHSLGQIWSNTHVSKHVLVYSFAYFVKKKL